MTSIQAGLRRIIEDRHSPEAAAFYQTMLKFIHKRLQHQASTRWRGILNTPDVDELLGDVLFQLMQGDLARFRGDTMAELMAFVRVMTDRTTWRVVDRRLRERDAVTGMLDGTLPSWAGEPSHTDDGVDWVAESPLPEADRGYLEALLAVGSKAELARTFNVSRAAVTQRVQRIQDRIATLSPSDRSAHEAWLTRTAASVLESAHAPDD